ncbi:hypothetical protein EJ419_02360 [Alloscardovia theropitheci]|uniref:Uncharacterized protein n=1 Tax=Alloscardovia theropitheci TaxID=2496842 RepID=A0A4R0QT66_9BIFI|nr:hypothetical protein [Alloscardovia theropitheci]TCD54698.1 hypothetical protein EJ419_02360 [Alloscardovia theropitheci]
MSPTDKAQGRNSVVRLFLLACVGGQSAKNTQESREIDGMCEVAGNFLQVRPLDRFIKVICLAMQGRLAKNKWE